MGDKRNPKYNQSGCVDPTSYEAISQVIKRETELDKMNDIFQVDYLPNAKKIIINLPEEVWKNIDTIIMTRLFQEELVVEKQKESEVEHDG